MPCAAGRARSLVRQFDGKCNIFLRAFSFYNFPASVSKTHDDIGFLTLRDKDRLLRLSASTRIGPACGKRLKCAGFGLKSFSTGVSRGRHDACKLRPHYSVKAQRCVCVLGVLLMITPLRSKILRFVVMVSYWIQMT